MSSETRLWLIRHAPVARPRGIIHDPDAPADLGDVAAIAALRAKLPSTVTVFASPSRRTLDTGVALGLAPIEEPSFREQSFGSWTGRRPVRSRTPIRSFAQLWSIRTTAKSSWPRRISPR